MSTIKGIFEPFYTYVTTQLSLRKIILQSPSEYKMEGNVSITLDDDDFNYKLTDLNIKTSDDFILTSEGIRNSRAFKAYTTEKQCIIRIASGVDIKETNTILEDKEKKLIGNGLAKRWVLEGGRGGTFDDTYNSSKYRSNPQDGFGMVPPPGITDATINTKSEDGSLREAKINYKCHNRRQLEVLEALYMRPGYPVLVEWGWDPIVKFGGGSGDSADDMIDVEANEYSVLESFLNSNSNLSSINASISFYKALSGGNYDGFVGFIKNFSFTVREDGGYDCVTTVIAHGEILESLKTKIKLVDKIYYEDSERSEMFNLSGSVVDGEEDNLDYFNRAIPREKEVVDEFLYYLRSIKTNLDKAGDSAIMKRIGTEQETRIKIAGSDRQRGETLDKYGVQEGVGLDYKIHPHIIKDPYEKAPNQSFMVYKDNDDNILPVKKLNEISTEYIDGFQDIKNLIRDVAKLPSTHGVEENFISWKDQLDLSTQEWQDIQAYPDPDFYTKSLWEEYWEGASLTKRDFTISGMDPIFEGTILKEISVDDEGENTSGVQKDIYVRWDLICQIINRRITPEYKKHHALVELTYLNPNQSTYTPNSSTIQQLDSSYKINNDSNKFYLEYSLPDMNEIFGADILNFSTQDSNDSSNNPPIQPIIDGEEFTIDMDDQVDFDEEGIQNNFMGIGKGRTGKSPPPILGRSFDHSICLMPHQIQDMKFSSQTRTRGFRQFTSFINTKVSHRSIGMVYFNLDHLIRTYEDLVLEEGTTTNSLGEERTIRRLKKNFSFHDWITTIWNDVNHACGGFYDFGLHVEHAKPNTARIIDFTFKGDSKQINKNRPIFEFNPEGLASIARNSSFSSKIDNDFASVISIAAQAPNDIHSLEAMSFKAFHKNIKNRFTTPDNDWRELDQKSAYDQYYFDLREYDITLKSLQFYINKMNEGNYETELSGPLNTPRTPISADTAKSMASKLEEMRHKLEARHSEFTDGYQNNIPGCENKDRGPGYDNCNKGEDYGMEAEEARPFIGSFKEGTTFSRAAILPITVSMTLDGIAGICPLQIFKINPDKLPIGYQDPNIVFVVKSEKNSITAGQDWTTELTGYLTLLNDSPNNGKNESVDVKKTNSTENQLDNIVDAPTISPNAIIALEFFSSQLLHSGYTLEQSAGIVACLMGESGQKLDPEAVNPTSGAYGVAQWLGTRRANLTEYSTTLNVDEGDFMFQLEFILQEITPSNKYSDFVSNYDFFKNATTSEEMLAAMSIYERWSYPTNLYHASGDLNGNGKSYNKVYPILLSDIETKSSPDSSLQQRIKYLQQIKEWILYYTQNGYFNGFLVNN